MVENQAATVEVAVPKEVSSKDYQPINDSKNVEKYVADYFKDIPLMAHVAKCESQNRQYDSSGAILRGKVNSADVGAFQINEYYHLETAKKMGLNLYTIDGNVRYARYLYEHEGAKPWMASSPCWSKFSQSEIAKK